MIDVNITRRDHDHPNSEEVEDETIGALRGLVLLATICEPPQNFDAEGESTLTKRFHFKTKQFILTRFSTLAILHY